ncbi:DUF2637 domain-containing protein [Mycobacterium intracellulare]|uniref:DUF2637 domain-containing protein n=1 Tax=Mycobacterium intracellulare TaxID=1767 RepID=UPI001EEE0132|nr:DUF2637 domain-containing protein [Mycobacterium intracellulare]MEE3755232.1 DUF2637 domain-containing protein [Mycobacterium intracellulare]
MTTTVGAPVRRAVEPADRRSGRITVGRGLDSKLRTAEERARAQARAFCWAWLLFAAFASVSGNVLHAWMTAPAALRLGAAVAAIFPPLLLLGATHLVALLISTRRRRYRSIDLVVLLVVMVGAIGVAGFAFSISFYALRDLMLLFGQGANVAWRWPIAVDLSLIVSSLAMLSLTEARITRSTAGETHPESHAAAGTVERGKPSRPTERRLWWESIASEVREELIDIRNIADLTPQRLGEILERMYDRRESDRGISDYTRLRHKEVKAIRESADGVLSRASVAAERLGTGD